MPALVNALSVTDLTDPASGPHALQQLVDAAVSALSGLWNVEVRTLRSGPIVAVEDNYDRLGYPSDTIVRDTRYTRYVSNTTMLRSHTSAGIPPALRRLAAEQPASDVLLVLPGLCHRRDTIDRLHTGTPHQLDLWLLRRGGRRLDHDDLLEMIGTLIDALLPGSHWRWSPASHPYTVDGREVDAIRDGTPVEIAECGLAAPDVLAAAGMDPSSWTGLALGIGLDRLLMLRKGIPDIRLLRSDDPRVAGQMLDLAPYQPVSDLPPARRDISIAAPPDIDAEILGDQVREALGPDAELVEELAIVSHTPYGELPASARQRLGIRPGQVNLLVRLILRPASRTMTSAEANELHDRVHAAVHHGG
ncbi:hypothetical protein EF847_04800 [Actinobacteria bacterium YIM 96077]|uniref:FDX-ACB domain-containing protein n=1 Tax=Phytoactinopolyspora halophila TaxID=1981511 RepID=A0A329R6H8_9ACTN|nr:hypothetical protein EF847_04800 [Actinobacteria bacterium YIM 96077]RAW18638.1 hypothetical protein DPM12_00715 [Phytoactinopolyspora halophila]